LTRLRQGFGGQARPLSNPIRADGQVAKPPRAWLRIAGGNPHLTIVEARSFFQALARKGRKAPFDAACGVAQDRLRQAQGERCGGSQAANFDPNRAARYSRFAIRRIMPLSAIRSVRKKRRIAG